VFHNLSAIMLKQKHRLIDHLLYCFWTSVWVFVDLKNIQHLFIYDHWGTTMCYCYVVLFFVLWLLLCIVSSDIGISIIYFLFDLNFDVQIYSDSNKTFQILMNSE